MVWAVIVALLLLSPVKAWAVEEPTIEEWEQMQQEEQQQEEQEEQQQEEQTAQDEESGTQRVLITPVQHTELLKELDVINSTIVTLQTDINNDDESNKRQTGEIKKEISELKNKLGDILKELEGQSDSDEIAQLKAISSKLDTLIADTAQPALEAVEPVVRNRAGNMVFTVYGNANPTNQYSTYAKQLIPKMGWKDDYVYFQDTANSYVLVWGDIDWASAGTFTGTQCKYTRWYYSGTGSGYLVESGVSNVVVSTDNHVVLSSLAEFPLLDDGFTLYRQEVCFYAVVALVIFCLSNVWNWLVRMRGYAG